MREGIWKFKELKNIPSSKVLVKHHITLWNLFDVISLKKVEKTEIAKEWRDFTIDRTKPDDLEDECREFVTQV